MWKQCPTCGTVSDAKIPVCPSCQHQFSTPPPNNQTQFFNAPPPINPPPTSGPNYYTPQYAQPAASGNAILSLVLGILSWVSCGLVGIPGVIIAKNEMNDIQRKIAPRAGYTYALIGYWLSLISLCLCVCGLSFWALLFFLSILVH